ncbi:aspartate kinase [Chloroflexota bacterium]
MSKRTLVMKFGGTSVGTAKAMLQAAGIVDQARQDWDRVLVITSAMAGVTNLLIESATQAALGDADLFTQSADHLYSKHNDVIEALLPDPTQQAQVRHEIKLLLNEFSNLCQAISVLGEATARALDAVTSLGERLSVRLLAAVLQTQGVTARYVEATRLIVTDDHFSDAHPDLGETAQLANSVLEPFLAAGQVPVITGYIAANRSGVTTTLGRGGSDYSAALLGAALPADEVWIWTDVDGVMTADPRLAPNACTIEKLSYREVAELAYFGAKVLHPKTIRPVIEAGIPLRVRNTFNPDNPGTLVVKNGSVEGNNSFKAVTLIQQQRLVTIEGRGMLGVPGVAARTFAAVAATGTSVPLITQASSEQSICFAVPCETTQQVMDSLDNTFKDEVARNDIDRIWATDEVVIITVVGAGMRNTPGIAGRVFSALGSQGVNVIAIAQGSSEVSISLVVDSQDAKRAVLALHELIYCDK